MKSPIQMIKKNIMILSMVITAIYVVSVVLNKNAHKRIMNNIFGKLILLAVIIGVTYVSPVLGGICALSFLYTTTKFVEGFEKGSDENDDEKDEKDEKDDDTVSVVPEENDENIMMNLGDRLD